MSGWAGVSIGDMVRWGGGSLFWAFRHVIAVRVGSVLLMPDRCALGDLRAAVAACPVPYDTILSALDPGLCWRPLAGVDAAPASGVHEAHWMAGPGPWDAARLPGLPGYVLRHVGGLRLAVADNLVALDLGRPHEAHVA